MIIGLIECESSFLMSTKNKKNLQATGQLFHHHDPCDPSKNGDPFDPWPMTHWPISISGPKTSKFGPDFGQLLNLIGNISRAKQKDIVRKKTALQTAIFLAHAYLTWWTLVHKRRKIGPEFPPTQRARQLTIVKTQNHKHYIITYEFLFV